MIMLASSADAEEFVTNLKFLRHLPRHPLSQFVVDIDEWAILYHRDLSMNFDAVVLVGDVV